MNEYQKMYYLLFNAVTDALSFLRTGDAAAAERMLTAAQQTCEDIYISWEETSGHQL